MNYLKLLTLRGPNVWSVHPAVEAWLDLESPAGLPAELVQALPDRLQALLSCSARHPGCTGRLHDLPAGHPPAHLLADVAVELQNLAGSAVRFTAVADSHRPGVSKVVVEYHCEELGRASLQLALR